MHIDTLSMTGKVNDLHYQRLITKQNGLRKLDLYSKVKQGRFRFLSELTHRNTQQFFKAYFMEVFACDIVKNDVGKNGFEYSFRIYFKEYPKAVGFLAFGGNKDSYQIYINGEGCNLLRHHFIKLYNTAEFFNMHITRIDIAQDFYEGKYNVAYAKRAFNNDKFSMSARGRKPTAKYIDDMGSGEGKTLYVGKLASSGREVCIYEKGLQVHSKENPDWVRWELRLGKRDRVLPNNLIINYQSYFINELPVLGTICKGLNIVEHAISSLRAKKERVQADMEHLLDWGSIMYGKLIYTAKTMGWDADKIVERLQVEGVPSRLIV